MIFFDFLGQPAKKIVLRYCPYMDRTMDARFSLEFLGGSSVLLTADSKKLQIVRPNCILMTVNHMLAI